MIKFVVYEDNISMQDKIMTNINKVMLPSENEYRIDKFINYDTNLKKLILEDGPKIYILDIEVPNKSGLDLAREIRESGDWVSPIIISTAHEDLSARAFRLRLMILDIISKFDNYEVILKENIEIALAIIDCRKKLIFEYNKIHYIIDLSDILFITPLERKTIITTKDNEYLSNISFSDILEHLDSRFIKTHRSCIVNSKQIKSIDYKDNIIIFTNGKKIDLLTLKYKKGLREYVTN